MVGGHGWLGGVGGEGAGRAGERRMTESTHSSVIEVACGAARLTNVVSRGGLGEMVGWALFQFPIEVMRK